MRKIIRGITAVLTVLVLNGIGFTGHTTAAPMHNMNGMNHEKYNSATCVTLCRTAVVDASKQTQKEEKKVNDEEPFTPYYLQMQRPYIDTYDYLTAICQSAIKPPPKVPIYILHCVSRS